MSHTDAFKKGVEHLVRSINYKFMSFVSPPKANSTCVVEASDRKGEKTLLAVKIVWTRKDDPPVVDPFPVIEENKKLLAHSFFFVKDLAWRESETFTYVAMEYFPLQDMETWIAERKKCNPSLKCIPEEQVWGLLQDVAFGLSFLHAAGSVHLNLKPSNVLIYVDNQNEQNILRVKLTGGRWTKYNLNQNKDFDLERWWAPELFETERGSSLKLLTGGVVSGNSKSDMWAFGCLVFELLLQKHLRFQAMPVEEVVKSSIDKALALGYSESLCKFGGKLLRLDPNERINAHQALQEILEHTLSPHSSPPSGSSSTPPARTRARKRKDSPT